MPDALAYVSRSRRRRRQNVRDDVGNINEQTRYKGGLGQRLARGHGQILVGGLQDSASGGD